MHDSILASTKKILGISDEYTAFDLDIMTHINAVFFVVNQLGVGPTDVVVIEGSEDKWSDISDIPPNQLSMLKTYMYMKVRMLFDPPATSFVIDAMNNQIKELEYRLSYAREDLIPVPVVSEVHDGW